MLVSVPEKILKVFSDSAKEIKALTEKLKKQAEGEVNDKAAWAETTVILVPTLLDDVVERKRLEYSNCKNIEIIFDRATCAAPIFIKADPTDLKSILSNLINNAIEASAGFCKVIVSCKSTDGYCEIFVTDNGVGIPADLVDQIGKKRITFKSDNSRGLGLVHAFERVEFWGGSIEIVSEVNCGTQISIKIPTHNDLQRHALLQQFGQCGLDHHSNNH